MSFKIGDRVKLLTKFYEDEDITTSVSEGSILEVLDKCRTAGQWIDQTSVELEFLGDNYCHRQEFELVTEHKEQLKVSKFKIGDRVISVKNTPAVPEGFIGYIVSDPFRLGKYDYVVRQACSGFVEYFKEDELELLSPSNNFKDVKVKHGTGGLSFDDPLMKVTPADIEGIVKPDVINSPKHYAVFESVEAIQVIASSMTQEQFYGYCLGNCLKYRLRAGAKDDVMQELGKANKYQELYTEHKHLCKEGK